MFGLWGAFSLASDISVCVQTLDLFQTLFLMLTLHLVLGAAFRLSV